MSLALNPSAPSIAGAQPRLRRVLAIAAVAALAVSVFSLAWLQSPTDPSHRTESAARGPVETPAAQVIALPQQTVQPRVSLPEANDLGALHPATDPVSSLEDQELASYSTSGA